MTKKQIKTGAAESARHPTLFQLMTPAETRRARAIAYEAALAVIG
jgi:hypothetical protein